MNAENTTSQDTASTTAATNDSIHSVVESIVNLGNAWAQHGINAGRLALKTQSTWLRGASTLLNQLADAMEPMTRPGAFSQGHAKATEPTTREA